MYSFTLAWILTLAISASSLRLSYSDDYFAGVSGLSNIVSVFLVGTPETASSGLSMQ